MTLTDLKLKLNKMEKHELCEFVVKAFKESKAVNDYIQTALGEKKLTDDLYETYLKKIEESFENIYSFKIKNSKEILDEYEKISTDIKSLSKLQTMFCYYASDFSFNYGSMGDAYYSIVLEVFEKALKGASEDISLISELNETWLKILDLSSECDRTFGEKMQELYNSNISDRI